jgi:hypothetical protein
MKKCIPFLIIFCVFFKTNSGFSQLSTTNLPIIRITTNSTILDEPKVPGKMEIFNSPGQINSITNTPNFTYNIGIELRGSTSMQLSDKKPFGIETRNEKGENLNVSLLGMPADNDWVLIAPYSDKSLIRDHLSYTFSRAMNRYASRTRFVEVIVNGNYHGVCFLGEKIKQGKDRVNIAKLKDSDISGDDLTGGYILKIDKTTGSKSRGWSSNYFSSINKVYFQVDYPKLDDIKDQQFNYIQKIVNDFEARLSGADYKDLEKGYSKVIDIDSFIDFFLINELTRNVDGYRLSTYFFKDKDSNGGKIKMGPAWDFNLAFGNANYCDGWKFTGWAYKFNEVCPSDGAGGVPFWWNRLISDGNFQTKLKTRWVELRKGALTNEKINFQIDSATTLLKDAQVRNFQRWNIMGRYIWPNYHFLGDYDQEISWTKDWIRQRLAFMDESELLNPNVLADEGPILAEEKLLIYPNPVINESKIRFEIQKKQFVYASLKDFRGKTVKIITQKVLEKGNHEFVFDRNNLPAGMYFFSIEKDHKSANYQKIIVN